MLAKELGFTLAEIGQLLAARRQGRGAWDRLAERTVAELDARIVDTQRAKQLIEHALECPHRDLFSCPNFRSVLEAHLERSREPPVVSPSGGNRVRALTARQVDRRRNG